MSDNKLLYEYAKEAHQAEIDRLFHLEEKADRYFSAYGFLLTAAGVLIGLAFERFIPPSGILGFSMFTLVVILGLGLLVSGYFVFRVMKPVGLSVPPLNEAMIKVLKGPSEAAINEALADAMSKSLAHNRGVVNRNSNSLKRAYWSVVATTCLLGLFGSLFLVHKWVN